jgi:hypothetical protein
LERHCADVGRDPTEIRRSAQALVALSGDAGELGSLREQAAAIPMPSLVGSAGELEEQLGAYVAAGVDEFVVNERSFWHEPKARLAVMDRILEVARRVG